MEGRFGPPLRMIALRLRSDAHGGAFLKEDGFDFTKGRPALFVDAPARAGMTRLAAAERQLLAPNVLTTLGRCQTCPSEALRAPSSLSDWGLRLIAENGFGRSEQRRGVGSGAEGG